MLWLRRLWRRLWLTATSRRAQRRLASQTPVPKPGRRKPAQRMELPQIKEGTDLVTLQKQRTWVSTPLDLLAPWGVCLLSAGLCLWGMLAGKPMGNESVIVPQLIMAAVGLIFLAFIPLWYYVRSRLRRFHYITNGVYVVQGQKNKPAEDMVSDWINWVLTHWVGKEIEVAGLPLKLTANDVMNALQGVTLFFLDEEKLSVWGRFVRGYSWGKDVVVGWRADQIEQQGTTDWSYVERLTRHELSHPILGFNGVGWNEKLHHKIFQATKLGS